MQVSPRSLREVVCPGIGRLRCELVAPDARRLTTAGPAGRGSRPPAPSAAGGKRDTWSGAAEIAAPVPISFCGLQAECEMTTASTCPPRTNASAKMGSKQCHRQQDRSSQHNFPCVLFPPQPPSLQGSTATAPSPSPPACPKHSGSPEPGLPPARAVLSHHQHTRR